MISSRDLTDDQLEDLKAFERRMIEVVSSLQPSIWRWRFILFLLIFLTLLTFYALIVEIFFGYRVESKSANDSDTPRSSFSAIFFRRETYFSISLCLLFSAFLFGIHRKIFASSIIVARFRYVLTDYNMSCDSHGRLIMRPRTITT